MLNLVELYYRSAHKSMGKRELLVIAAFVVLGAIVYQVTAPAADPNRVSPWSAALDHIRREIRGNPGSAEVVRTDTHALSKETAEIRLTGQGSGQLTIIGEDRQDVASELRVWSNGVDDAEAKRLAEETALKVSEAGGSLTFAIRHPEPGRQRSTLTLRVPARLRAHVGRTGERLAVSGIESLEVLDVRGEATIGGIRGRVSLTQRGGDLSITNVGALRLSVNGCDVRLQDILGDATLQARAGEIRAVGMAGPIELEANSTDVTIENMQKTKGPIRINAVAGRVTLRGLAAEARVDARHADLEIAIDRAAPIAIYTDGEDLHVTPPAGGYVADALATNGQLTFEDGGMGVEKSDREQRAAGSVRGGGPTLTLRATNADIVVRQAARDRTAPDDPR